MEQYVNEVIEIIKSYNSEYDLTKTHKTAITILLDNLLHTNPNAVKSAFKTANGGEYRHSKGLHIYGRAGIGKTTIFKAVAEWSVIAKDKGILASALRYINMSELVKKCQKEVSMSPIESYLLGNVCIGDVGTEPANIKLYSNEHKPFYEFVEQREEKQKSVKLKFNLYLDTNLNKEHLHARYDDMHGRISSRLSGMLNDELLLNIETDYRKK